MDQEQLVTFCSEIIKLKQQLKCPICLEIIQETAELQCGHRFCLGCYNEQKDNANNQINNCPVCKAVITRRSLIYKDDFADKIGSFVNKICNRIEKANNCSIEEILHNDGQPLKRKSNNSKVLKSNKKKLSEQTTLSSINNSVISDGNTLIKKTVKSSGASKSNKTKAKNPKTPTSIRETRSSESQVNNKGNDNKTSVNDPSTSKEDVSDKILAIPQKSKVNKKESKIKNKRKSVDNASNSIEDAFDKLLATPQKFTVNKKGSRTKYSRKRKENHGNDYKILEFDNINTKTAVLEWLNDTKNKFDRLTQTQCLIEIKDDNEELQENTAVDLTSVSQNKQKTKTLENIKKKRRAKSVDLELKPKPEKTFLSDLGLWENYSIEEINTEDMVLKKAEENAFLHIIEDKYLNKIESDLQKNEPKSRQKVNSTTQNSTFGWDRVEKMSKTIRKKGRTPKKLSVTVVQASQTSSGKKNPKKKSRKKVENKHTEKIKTNLNKSDRRSKETDNIDDKMDTDYCEALQKPIHDTKISEKINYSQHSEKDSNKENNESSMNVVEEPKKILVLSDITVHRPDITPEKDINNVQKVKISPKDDSKNDIDLYMLPTQKLNFSNEESFIANLKKDDSISELDNFNDVVEKFKDKLEMYIDHIDNDRQLTKQHIKNIQKYLEKLNDLHKIVQNKPTTECIDLSIQTEHNMCHIYTQTEKVKYSDIEIQTTNIPVKNFTFIDISSSIQKGLENIEKCNLSNNVQKTQDHDKIPENIEKQSEDFGGTLDLLNFETQDIINRHLEKSKEQSLISAEKLPGQKESVVTQKVSNTQTDQINRLSGKEDPNVLICSIKSDSEKKTKRTLSDSDSSDIVLPKRRCNRFIRDDLSIEFDFSEKIKTQKDKCTTELLPESDEDNDEEYLNKILKKYENGGSDENCSVTSKKEDRLMDACDNIVAQVNENVEKLAKLNETTNSSFKTASQNSRDGLNKNHLSLNDISNVRNEDDKINSEVSDIIAETETLEPIPKKPKTKTLNKGFNTTKVSFNKSQDRVVEEETNSPIPIKHKDTFCQELEDGLDDADFENIQIDEEIQKNTIENVNLPKSNEEDLFSDEDVVETTPQKENKFSERRSQLNITNLSKCFSPLDNAFDDNFDLNFVPLAPPPGFEDDSDTTIPEEDITVVNVKPTDKNKTTTPNNSLQKNIEPNLGYMTPKQLPLQKVMHSTPITQIRTQSETLGLSPIVQEKSLIEKAFKSNNTIISVGTQETPRKHNILTSNPKQKSILNYVKDSQNSFESPKEKPCIACTRLSKDQTQSISYLTNKKLATYSAKFNNSVTHMIVSVDESKRIKDYTMKFVSAVASGIWVLGFEWIQECLKKNAIVPEEPYEALDDSGGSGPKIARLTKNDNPLFKGFQFYCIRPSYFTTVEDIEDVITKLGGATVRNLQSLKENNEKISLIITEDRSTQDSEIYELWLEKYKIITVDIEWLSKSVGRYKVLSVRPYTWCADDVLDDLGYPSYLTENTACSSSEPN